jgi:regulator of replication initiation timing
MPIDEDELAKLLEERDALRQENQRLRELLRQTGEDPELVPEDYLPALPA